MDEFSKRTQTIDEFMKTRTRREQFWVDHQPFLRSQGYELRPRYHPDWTPSWTFPGSNIQFGDYSRFEDSFRMSFTHFRVLDATRISDNSKVVLRRVSTRTPELKILSYLNSSEQKRHPHNKTFPLLGIVPLSDDDGEVIIVMPFLRLFNSPAFRHLREVVEAMRQFFQGLNFMHSQNIAHRDPCFLNLMMDPSEVVPGGSHFTKPRLKPTGGDRYEWRDRCLVDTPVAYYFIDFGLTEYYPNGVQTARDIGIYGQDKTAPELSDTIPYNPFKVDIYQLGNSFVELSEKYPILVTIFGSLLEAMTHQNPDARPSASQTLQRFEKICSDLSPDELGKKLVYVPDTEFYDSGESLSDYELFSASSSDESDNGDSSASPSDKSGDADKLASSSDKNEGETHTKPNLRSPG